MTVPSVIGITRMVVSRRWCFISRTRSATGTDSTTFSSVTGTAINSVVQIVS